MKSDFSENNTINIISGICSFDSSDDDDDSKDSRTTKHVSFSRKVSMQIHSLVLGDSPACPLLPLQLDWNYDLEFLDLDMYESSVATRRRRMRGPKKIHLYERWELLHDVAGYSLQEIDEKYREAKHIIKQQESEATRQAVRDAFMGGEDYFFQDMACITTSH